MDTGERIIDTAPPGPENAATLGANNGHAAESVKDPAAANSGETDAAVENGTHVARAEQLVDRFAEGIAGFTSRWGRRVLWLGTRIKEEAEDMWAEAQSIRRGDQK
jgi:hypothetical protein